MTPPPGQKERRKPKGFRRGVSILPVLFTTGNLFCGFWAVIRTMNGQFAEAAPLIGIAIVLDLLDGRIARMTGTASEFGGELDSLADVISFGIAPAVLVYRWGFDTDGPASTLPRLGLVASFLFLTCVALRLARFNVQRHVVDSRFFVGLPSPAGAAQVAAVVYAAPEPVVDKRIALIVMSAVLVLALLMVSTLRYRSFKSIDLRSRRSYVYVVLIAAAIALAIAHSEWVLLTTATVYTISGPLGQVLGFGRRREPPAPMVAHEAH
jgi:CDP-diacylglycerol--serine O-phosphatidyltransferase